MSQPGPHGLSRRKRVAFWAVTLLLPVGTVLVGVELLLRALEPGGRPRSRGDLERKLAESERTEVRVVTTGNLKGLIRPSTNPDLVYELKPSRRWVFQGAETSTNRHGLRGSEIALDKPADTLRVVGLGDSVMFGWGVDQQETFMAILERQLDEAPLEKRVEVLNFAVPGYNTQQEAIVFREKCLAFSPDLLLISYSLNDWAAPFFVPHPDRDGIIESSLLVDLLRKRLQGGATSYFDAYQGMDKVIAALREIAGLAREREIPVIFFIYPQELSGADAEHFAQIAGQNGFEYLDLDGPFQRYFDEQGLPGIQAFHIREDDYHPNAEGHGLIAQTLEPHVIAALAKREARSTTAMGAPSS